MENLRFFLLIPGWKKEMGLNLDFSQFSGFLGKFQDKRENYIFINFFIFNEIKVKLLYLHI